MNTKLVNSAAGVILAALTQNRTAASIALALDSAQLLMTPQTAAEYEQLRNDITGACLARWEEEQENARLRLALASAKRGRRELRARVAELEAGPVTVFRAAHDSIVMGLYTTAAAAREHCEAEERRSWAKSENPSFDWIEDEEDGVAELTAWVGGEECTTGYVVTALEVASEYDEEADE
ncbi:hypothetical protein [Streptomyces cellulosae]|uniref:hypothetical protein n=1 Tax=Streptomyces cellulosae TaxID=1968 RepID=UPI00068DFC8B|nr:hypothetical protein [Streptomyces cellulosae]